MTRAEISRRWRQRHPDKVKAQKARYYQKHKAEHDAKRREWAVAHPEAARQWRERNREKLKADRARWYQEHKKEQNARSRAWAARNPEGRKEHVTRYYDKNHIPHALANARVKAKVRGYVFAVTKGDVERARTRQGDRCAICGNPETRQQNGRVQRLAIDHSHESGEFRGLLCEACNKVLGFAQDDIARLRIAANYLERTVHGYDFDGHA